MWWEYLKAVLGRALWFTPRWTDGLQVLTASALPGVARFAGVKMPDAVGSDALAYIGAATLAFIVIRLLWAPYSLWKDQLAENSALRLELSKPERIELEHMARVRARAKLRLAGELRRIPSGINEISKLKHVSKDFKNLLRLCGQSGAGPAVQETIISVWQAMASGLRAEEGSDERNLHEGRAVSLAADAADCLNGRITPEVLALRLRQDTEEETQRKISRDSVCSEHSAPSPEPLPPPAS